MFRSLRNRLIASHILPILLIIPLMGVAMLYVLETRLLLPTIYHNLAQDASLLAEVTRSQPVIWQNRELAQAVVDELDPYLSGRVSMVTLDGRVLASSDASSGVLGTSVVDLPNLAGVGQGEVVQLQNGPLAEVVTPVYDMLGHPIGAVRLSTRVLTVSEQIYQLRYLLVAVLLFGLLGGVALGSYLALTINRPIQHVTNSIQSLADGNWQASVQEEGPDEIRSLARAVNGLVLRLNTLEKARRQLLANLVHELGRPLGAIHSAIQALLKGAGQDAQLAGDLLTGMDKETIRLERLVDELANLHDQVSGRLELDRQPVKLGEWLAITLSPWEAAAREKGLAWQTDIPPDLPAVQIDPDRLGQAVGNLLSNAVKFTPPGGVVSTTARLAEGQFTLQVADSGPGIPLDEQQRIFQPFYRSATGKRIVQGMGLGLSIARDIARAHGGDIQVDSAPGSGSHFTLYVPVGLH